jgi:hypothetical protein
MRRAAAGALLALVLSAAAPAPEAPAPASSPEVSLRVEVPVQRATVGDRLTVRVRVIHPASIQIDPPVPRPEEGSTLVLESVARAGSVDDKEKDVFLFQAQAFETGSVRIPAFQVTWRNAADPSKSGTAASEPVPIEIVSVLQGPKDAPADLKPPAEIPAPPFPWVLALLAAAALAALVAGLIYWKRRRRPAPAAPATPVIPPIPPHEWAYQELQRLLAGPLLRAGKIKEFHVELAEIVKRYLSLRFGFETLERTSEEVVEDLMRLRIGAEPLAAAREFFGQTDLVKFAKYRPAEDEIRRSVDRAYRLVDLTKLVEAPAQGAPAGGPAEAPVQRVGQSVG